MIDDHEVENDWDPTNHPLANEGLAYYNRFAGNRNPTSEKKTDDGRTLWYSFWHGPSLAFKDLGLQVLARILDFFLSRNDADNNGDVRYSHMPEWQ